MAPGYRRLFYLDELLSTTICTFFVGYNKVFITQERYHELFYDTLVQYAANAPENETVEEPS